MSADATFPTAFPEDPALKTTELALIVERAIWRRYGGTVLRLDPVLAFQFTPARDEEAAGLVVEYGGSRVLLTDHHAMQAWMDLQVMALGKSVKQVSEPTN